MDANKKKLIFLLGSIFVAVIFLTSYAAFSNNGSSNSSTSTVPQQATVVSTGTSNAIVSNYSSVANITFSASSNSISTNITKVLSQLQANGSISDYIYSNNEYRADLATISPYQLQQLLYKDEGSNKTINVGSTMYIILPAKLTLYYNNLPVTVRLTNRNYSIYAKNVAPLGSKVNVSILALLYRNGTIYQTKVNYSP